VVVPEDVVTPVTGVRHRGGHETLCLMGVAATGEVAATGWVATASGWVAMRSLC
jgi:hypothetical protein